MVSNVFLVVQIGAVLCTAAIGSGTSVPVSDEALRSAALGVIFPRMTISIDRKKIGKSPSGKPKPGERRFPDALARQASYRIIGKAVNKVEVAASEDMATGTFSNTRRVRFKLFRWPNEGGSGLLAVLQYDFQDARPVGCCWSIGLLAHLVRNAAGWSLRDEYLLETIHHSSLQRIELIDLTADGVDELVIESDFGGAGTAGISLQLFDLSRGRFAELLHTNAWLGRADLEGYEQVLDVGRTLRTHGRQFCFSKKILFEKGEWFSPPHVAYPCYARGEGVDSQAVGERNSMLTPLP